MRTLLGKLGAIAGPLLLAVPLFLLLSSAVCHAQADCPAATITSITPDTWVAGAMNNFVITGTNLASGLLDPAGFGFCGYEESFTTANGDTVPTTFWNQPTEAYSVYEWNHCCPATS
jgi:hypothetical protein